MKNRLVIFDLGGTTIHDYGDVPAAFAEALEAAGVSLQPGQIDRWRGAAKREVLERLLPGDGQGLERALEIFQRSLRHRLLARTDLAFPAAARVFQQLRSAGGLAALNSGFERDIVSLIIECAGWERRWFSAIISADDVSRGRPAPDMILLSMERSGVNDPARVAVVGDTRFDMEAGVSAGVACRVGVLSGAHGRDALQQAGATHIAPDVSLVLDILDRAWTRRPEIHA